MGVWSWGVFFKLISSTFAFNRLFPLNKTGLLVELGFNLIGTVLVMHKAHSWALGWFLVLYIPCMVTHTCNSSTLKDGSRMIQKFEVLLNYVGSSRFT